MGNPSVQDNIVYALSVHLEQWLLILHTEFRDGPSPSELTNVRFAGFVAHHFDHVSAPSILFDVAEVSMESVIQTWRELFEQGAQYMWPPVDFEYTGLFDLAVGLVERGVRAYRVSSSCGMVGYVLAAGVKYEQRDNAMTLN